LVQGEKYLDVLDLLRESVTSKYFSPWTNYRCVHHVQKMLVSQRDTSYDSRTELVLGVCGSGCQVTSISCD